MNGSTKDCRARWLFWVSSSGEISRVVQNVQVVQAPTSFLPRDAGEDEEGVEPLKHLEQMEPNLSSKRQKGASVMAETRIEKDTMGEIAVAVGPLLGRTDPAFAEVFPGRGRTGHDAERAHQGLRHP